MTTIRADDNWFQRRYFAWAEPHYERMPPRLRAEVERIDRWLYSRRAAWLWIALALGAIGSSAVLSLAGLPTGLAVFASLLFWTAMPLAILGAWLHPERFAGRRVIRSALLVSLIAYLGVAAGFLAKRIVQRGGLELATLAADARHSVVEVAPLLVFSLVMLGAVLELAAFARRRVLRGELERAGLVGERDAAARQAAEAQLRLLQGQIRPHFVFNTLASLQHWVDTADPRAGPLLRSLTGLLRATTEAMTAPFTPLGAECEAAGHYLAVMRARLGDRLAWRIEVAADCAGVELPTGLVLTLVENAVEHGIEPAVEGGTVAVTALREGDAVTLSVDDDGVGLGPDADAGDPARRGVGIANSRERLRHRYAGAATLELLPAPAGRGTRARVRIVARAA
ncbi:MAG: histidine kinase [Burkholderiales bacterium]|nr:histidine kinase [Burkholderiales bacterium]